MAYFLFKCWRERLFFLGRQEVVYQENKLQLEFVSITTDNFHWVINMRGQAFKEQFEEHIQLGDFGLFALIEGIPVGYGWVKHEGSKDYFFHIPADTCYLCRFFVREEMRGRRIYHAIITELIKREVHCNRFFIATERGNVASENGLKRVGFKFVNEFRFIRGFRRTLNKKVLATNSDH